MSANIDDAWELLSQENMHVYLAGLLKTSDINDKVFSERAGGDEASKTLKQGLIEEDRWQELLYS